MCGSLFWFAVRRGWAKPSTSQPPWRSISELTTLVKHAPAPSGLHQTSIYAGTIFGGTVARSAWQKNTAGKLHSGHLPAPESPLAQCLVDSFVNRSAISRCKTGRTTHRCFMSVFPYGRSFYNSIALRRLYCCFSGAYFGTSMVSFISAYLDADFHQREIPR